MKNKSISLNLAFILTAFLILSSCQKDEVTPTEIKKQFVVDKIYNYNNDLIAEYTYDKENRLIKKFVTEHLGRYYQQEWSSYSDEFEYQDGLVSKITHKNISNNMFFYDTYIHYNSLGKIINTEVHIPGQPTSTKSDYRYKNGNLVGTTKYNIGTIVYADSVVYNNSENVIKYIYEVPEMSMAGTPIPETKTSIIQNCNFDNHSKPNFSIDYLFIYDPLPFSEEAELQRRLSANNLTELTNGTKWIYTYNEFGLPSTIEVKWKNVETTIPMILRIVYKEIY